MSKKRTIKPKLKIIGLAPGCPECKRRSDLLDASIDRERDSAKSKAGIHEALDIVIAAAEMVVGDCPPMLRGLLRHEMIPNRYMDALREAIDEAKDRLNNL